MPHLILHCAPDRFAIFSDDLGLNWQVSPDSRLPGSTWLTLMGQVRAETGQGTQRFLHLLEGSATPATTGLLRALEILERELEKVLEDKVALARQLEESERTRHSAEDALALAAARIEALEAELEAIRAARRSEPDESLFRRLAGLAGAALIAASTLSAGVAGGFDIYTHLTDTPAAATAQLKPAAPALSNVIGQAQIVIEQCQVGDPPRP